MPKKPRTHRLTKYIKVLGKQNTYNTYAACIACVEKLDREEVLKNTFTNKKPQVKNHLKNCPYFQEKIGNQKELDDIINLTDNEIESEENYKRQKINHDAGKNNEKVLKYLRSLQSNFIVPNFRSTEEEISVKSFASTSTSSTYNFHPVTEKKRGIGSSLVRKFTKKEIPKFERLLLRMSVANGFPFQWVNHPATLEFFEFLSPLLVLPKRKALSNRILNRETEDLNILRDEKLKNDKVGVVLAFDGWKNILNQHIFGSLFITSSGEVLIWETSDISSERERIIEVIPKITGLIQEIIRLNIKLNAIVSDSAPAYAAARRRLRIEYPEIVFLPCFAHQCQLAIGDIFKESPTLKTASIKAIKVAAYFKNANNSYFIGKLRDIQKELYSKYYSIMVPGETRWNSHYFCFKSLVRSKQALRNLAIRHECPPIIPPNTNELYLSSELCKILLDNDWWDEIELLQDILLPYCGILNKLQCDKARLFEVLHALGYLVQYWKNFPDIDLSDHMIGRLEKRWNQWEQPLLLLSFMLHPGYRLSYFNPELNNLSFTTLGRYLTYYYKAWFKKRPLRLLLEFEDFQQKQEPFNNETFEQFGGDVFKFWAYVEGDYKELAAVALRIFGMCVNAASVERMWSSMGFLHTVRRNRLKNDKVLAMSQLRASINFSLREKVLHQHQIQFLDSNATPINEDEDVSKVPKSTEEDTDDVEDDNINIITSEHWEQELREWEEMIMEEELARMEDEEALRDNTDSSMNGDLLSEYTHPAIDKKAKWEFENLFSSSLQAPNYLNVTLTE